MKKIINIILVIILIGGIFYYARMVEAPEDPVQDPVVEDTKIALCFYSEEDTLSGLQDKQWLKLNLTGNTVSGEYYSLPAEKDKKSGPFQGSVSAVDPIKMARVIDALWSASAEGVTNTEQLIIEFGEGTAYAGYGEMIDNGDGIYRYKDPSNLTFGLPMIDVACSDLDDLILVEQYVRDNIKTLTPDKPVLGGNWYVTSIHIDTISKTGNVEYEDGHIVGSAQFAYIRDGNNITIEIIE